VRYLLLLALLLCGCASKKPASCEEIFYRCERLCESTASKGFHGPEHLPPPITKGPKSCREGCSDELQICKVARSKEETQLFTCASETYGDYLGCLAQANLKCPKGHDEIQRGSSYSKVGGFYDMHLQVRCW
jgi:hypothetical protein